MHAGGAHPVRRGACREVHRPVVLRAIAVAIDEQHDALDRVDRRLKRSAVAAAADCVADSGRELVPVAVATFKPRDPDVDRVLSFRRRGFGWPGL